MSVRGAGADSLPFMLLGGYDILSSLTEITEEREAILYEATPIGVGDWPRYVHTGLRSWRIEQRGFLDAANNGAHEALMNATWGTGSTGDAFGGVVGAGQWLHMLTTATGSGPGGSRVLCYAFSGGAQGAAFMGGFAGIHQYQVQARRGELTKAVIRYGPSHGRGPEGAATGPLSGAAWFNHGQLDQGVILLPWASYTIASGGDSTFGPTYDAGASSTAPARFYLQWAWQNLLTLGATPSIQLQFQDSTNGTTWRNTGGLINIASANAIGTSDRGPRACAVMQMSSGIKRYIRVFIGGDAVVTPAHAQIFAGLARQPGA